MWTRWHSATGGVIRCRSERCWPIGFRSSPVAVSRVGRSSEPNEREPCLGDPERPDSREISRVCAIQPSLTKLPRRWWAAPLSAGGSCALCPSCPLSVVWWFLVYRLRLPPTHRLAFGRDEIETNALAFRTLSIVGLESFVILSDQFWTFCSANERNASFRVDSNIYLESSRFTSRFFESLI